MGPRTPFAQDNALDYSIDEGIEWEAEDPAEVDLGSALDEDEEHETDDEDEMDDWMVGDDEIEFEEGAEGYNEDKAVPEKKDQRPIEDYYTEVGKAGAVSRNQRFARLVPFHKGPCMETRLGEVDPVMDKYKICMLNGKLPLKRKFPVLALIWLCVNRHSDAQYRPFHIHLYSLRTSRRAD